MRHRTSPQRKLIEAEVQARIQAAKQAVIDKRPATCCTPACTGCLHTNCPACYGP